MREAARSKNRFPPPGRPKTSYATFGELQPERVFDPSQDPLSFAPGMLIEGAEHGECHGRNASFDGRFRHRSEQRRMIGRQLRPGSVACRGHALRLVDADIEKFETPRPMLEQWRVR